MTKNYSSIPSHSGDLGMFRDLKEGFAKVGEDFVSAQERDTALANQIETVSAKVNNIVDLSKVKFYCMPLTASATNFHVSQTGQNAWGVYNNSDTLTFTMQTNLESPTIICGGVVAYLPGYFRNVLFPMYTKSTGDESLDNPISYNDHTITWSLGRYATHEPPIGIAISDTSPTSSALSALNFVGFFFYV